MPAVILRALAIKKKVVELDEKETGLRRILNFGHTLGHGIESVGGLSELLHGECVALGMIPMTSPAIRPRLIALLESYHLPTRYEGDLLPVLDAVAHDKKMAGDSIRYVYVEEVGKYEIRSATLPEYAQLVKEALL